MSIASVDATGRPSVRVVLLRGLDDRGFVFYTNYDGRKGRELVPGAPGALVIHWPDLGAQVRAEGVVEHVSAEESDDYFAARPRGHRVGAWVSPQSEVIPDRAFLEARERAMTERFEGDDVPRPAHWGGIRLVPAVIEAALVSPNVRRYIAPEPAVSEPVRESEPEPKKPPPPEAKPKPQPLPPVKPPTRTVKTPPGITQPPKPKTDPKVRPEPKAKPRDPVMSRSAADALADEIRLAKKAQEEEARKALQEAARARLEAQTRAEVQAKAKADAQRQTQMAGETSQYLAEVKARVEHAWNRPASAKKGVQCTLEVDQAPTGTVLQARVINPCNGDEAVRASIRDAALRASPLPVPQNRDLFQRTLHLVFSPDD